MSSPIEKTEPRPDVFEICINGRFLTQPITGVQRYAVELTLAIDRLLARDHALADSVRVRLLVPRTASHELNASSIEVSSGGGMAGQLWEQFELPRLAGNAFIVNLCNLAPLTRRYQSVTIHDASVFAHPDTFSRAFGTWYRFCLRRLVRRAAHVFTVSEFSRQELARFTGLRPERCSVVYHGNEHIGTEEADLSVLSEHELTGQSYLLAVGGTNRRKGISTLVEAARLLSGRRFPIVVTGSFDRSVFGIFDSRVLGSVRWIGRVSDGQLRALYSNATAFIYPSLYEGFGLPALEAMSCGCPVVASDIPPLREVCGDAAVYCRPLAIEEFAHAIESVTSDQALRSRLRERGLARSALFSWDRAAEATLQSILAIARRG